MDHSKGMLRKHEEENLQMADKLVTMKNQIYKSSEALF